MEEIVNQVDYSIEQTGIDASEMKKLQIMFMSMGEPLLNLKALIPALYALYEKYPHARLLVSTSGPDVSGTAMAGLLQASSRIFQPSVSSFLSMSLQTKLVTSSFHSKIRWDLQ
jgi:adenine C2-methylase RlmN of 23S rRNA A2503 and tRNA A37